MNRNRPGYVPDLEQQEAMSEASKQYQQKFFNIREAAKHLDMDWRTFKRYVDTGIFPQGISVIGSKTVVWHRSDLAHMEWICRNHERFYRGHEPKKA